MSQAGSVGTGSGLEPQGFREQDGPGPPQGILQAARFQTRLDSLRASPAHARQGHLGEAQYVIAQGRHATQWPMFQVRLTACLRMSVHTYLSYSTTPADVPLAWGSFRKKALMTALYNRSNPRLTKLPRIEGGCLGGCLWQDLS